MDFPGGLDGKDGFCLQCRRPGFNPWVGKIPLEKGMATHFSILAWKTPWTEGPGRLQPMGLQRVGPNCMANSFTFTSPRKHGPWGQGFLSVLCQVSSLEMVLVNMCYFYIIISGAWRMGWGNLPLLGVTSPWLEPPLTLLLWKDVSSRPSYLFNRSSRLRTDRLILSAGFPAYFKRQPPPLVLGLPLCQETQWAWGWVDGSFQRNFPGSPSSLVPGSPGACVAWFRSWEQGSSCSPPIQLEPHLEASANLPPLCIPASSRLLDWVQAWEEGTVVILSFHWARLGSVPLGALAGATPWVSKTPPLPTAYVPFADGLLERLTFPFYHISMSTLRLWGDTML